MREPIKTESVPDLVPLASWSDAVGDDDDDDNEGEFYPFSCLLRSPPARPLRLGRLVARPGTGSRKDWMPLRARNTWVKSLKRNGGPTSACWPTCVVDGIGWPKLPRNPIKTPWPVGRQEDTMVRRLRRQLPFLRSVLREADQNVRRERLQHANADQVNAISELVMNTLKGNVAVPPRLLD